MDRSRQEHLGYRRNSRIVPPHPVTKYRLPPFRIIPLMPFGKIAPGALTLCTRAELEAYDDVHDRKRSFWRILWGTRGNASPALSRIQGASELGCHRQRRYGDRRVRRAEAGLPLALRCCRPGPGLRSTIADHRAQYAS